MRPLLHPAIGDVTVEAILHALADPDRVAIFAGILASSRSQTCTAFSHVNQTAIPKSTLSQHFKVLREAGLIHSERRGVEMQNTSRCNEVEERFPGLVASIVNAHKVQKAGAARASRAEKRKPHARFPNDPRAHRRGARSPR